MSMHLVGPYLTTNNTRKRKKKGMTQKQMEHQVWLEKRGLSLGQLAAKKKKTRKKYDSGYVPSDLPPLSNAIGNGFKQGIMANLYKESPEIQRAILDKASKVQPAYNKGGLQFVSDEELRSKF